MKNNKFTEFLKDISHQDLHRVGGKAANLGEMIKAGLPVPEGFVLVAKSYKKFIEFNKIKNKIEELLINPDYNEFDSIKKLSEKIKNLFIKGEIPDDIHDEIYKLYEQIGSPKVVVRSSSTMEDSPQTSFAGQYDSFLNVKGKKQLNKCIKQCWASLWNTRALSYRLKQNIEVNELTHAVLIQKFIKAEKSGVLFTANPVNNRRDQMLINASWGPGEAIVSGNVTPDRWIFDKKSRKFVEEKIADVPAEKCDKSSLDKNELVMVLGQKAEDYFKVPQDIEWACCNHKIYLIQSRPITTLFPKPEADSDEELEYILTFY